MAYKHQDLSVLAYANGFTLWHYTTGDALVQADPSETGALIGEHFSGGAADCLRIGDTVHINADIGAHIASAAQVTVTGNHGGVVAVGVMSQYVPSDA